MTAFAELRAEVCGLIDTLRGYGLTERLQRDLDQCIDELMSECVVVVAGEFSRGKSSMLNALVGHPGLFPVGVDITTSVVTELRWGERESAEVWLGETRETEEVSTVAGYITGQSDPANAGDVRLVRLTSPQKLLQHGMVLVDTPGIGSLNVEHATAAYAALGKANAVLFVGSADERMSTTELSYLIGAMTRCPLVITALTKTDMLYEPGPKLEVEVARERIAKASRKNPDEILVVGVSARRMHEAMRTHDMVLMDQSGFPYLEELLTASLVATWGKTRLNRALEVIGGVLGKAAAPVHNELLALSSDGALDKVRSELAVSRARAAELSTQSAVWRRELTDGFERESAMIREKLREACAAVKDDFIGAAYSDRVANEPDALVRESIARLVDAVEEAGAQLHEACERLAARASSQTQLRFTANVGVPPIEVDFRLPAALTDRRHSAGLVESAFKSAAVGTGVGTAMGGAIGTLLFPGVGTAVGLIGGLAGTLLGLFSGVYDHHVTWSRVLGTEVRDLLITLVQPRIERAIDRILSDAEAATEVTRDCLLAELENEIETARQSVAASISGLEADRTATEEELLSRRRQLTLQQAEFDRLWHQFDVIRDRAPALG